MSESSESDDKQYEPTQRKLDEARKKGDIPRSADLNTAAAYAGFIIVAYSIGSASLAGLASDLAGLLRNANELSSELFAGGQQAILGGAISRVIWNTAPWFAIPAIAVVLVVITQQSFVVAPTKIQPKLSRISILANAKNKFGRQGWFEFFKSATKLTIFSGFLGYFLFGKTDEIVATAYLGSTLATSIMLKMSLSFVVVILAVAAAIGVIDFLWHQAEHLRKNRMSRQEVVDEAKQMEGDPHLKQKRRQKAQEIALNKMLSDVPTADVIIVNPTHYAVALKWSREAGSAPICVAKGVDQIAARIREIANNSAVPIHRDPVTARDLHAALNVGDQIRPEHYAAVAAAIRFAENMRTKMKNPGWTQ